MSEKVHRVIWTVYARDSLNEILDYRYSGVPKARKIVRLEILNASKGIVFTKQYQIDEINSKYRRIIVRDYKLLYLETGNTVYVMNVICTRAGAIER